MGSKSKATETTAAWGKVFWLSVLALGLILTLGSYHSEDPSFSTFSSTWHAPRNVLGYFGSWTADIFFQVFGYGAWLWPSLLFIALARWMITGDRKASIFGARWWAGLSLILAAVTLFIELSGLAKGTTNDFPPPGLAGIALAGISRPFFGVAGSYLAVIALLWCFSMVWWESLPSHLVQLLSAGWERFRARLPDWVSFFKRKAKRANEAQENSEPAPTKAALSAKLAEMKAEEEEDDDDEPAGIDASAPVIREAKPQAEAKPARAPRPKSDEPRTPTEWELPPLSLLEGPKRKAKVLSREQLLEIARKITNALHSFEIEGEITEISPGPIITMYEFQPASGVRVQKILSASTDLAMTLGAPVRIVAPIPGKSVAGIEVPNPDKEDIVLKDVYESTRERAKMMKVPLVLGKDGEGNPVCEDLSRMPHLLIGGATSMGKSVLVNSILTGLLCRFNPDELRLIIVDPKLVEFKAFEDIPHLMLPIVNDPNDASQALRWAVSETRRRYSLMQKIGAKNIEGYNQKITELKAEDLKEGEPKPDRFSYIVIIIDELAELMLTGKKDVEHSIVRLSQLARAAGIHLIMSTQRPSADVVTGLIKSNCPSRVALRVASASDSRIVLDCAGAEQLIGKGDMFFTNTGPMGLRRMQGAYVSDPEIERICDFWREQGEPDYKDEILAPEPEEGAELEGSSEGLDPLYGDVIDFAKQKGKISTSLIQRQFSIGYTRAARIMEQLESRGIVGEAAAAGKARDVIL